MDPKKAEKITLKRNEMKLFKLDENNEMYMVNVPNKTCFFLVIDYIGCGMLFWHTIVVIRHTKDCLKV